MGWLAERLWRSASKNRLRASFLILSRSLCFSQNYWCMSGLEKQRGETSKVLLKCGCVLFFFCFFLFLFFFVRQLNVSTWILIGLQPSSGGKDGGLYLRSDNILIDQTEGRGGRCRECASHPSRNVNFLYACWKSSGWNSCVCPCTGSRLAF